MRLLRHTAFEPIVARVKRWTGTAVARRFSFNYERVLGTSLELQVVATTEAAAHRADAAVLAEVDRLEQIFSGYSAGSEFHRWQSQRDVILPVSPELADVLSAAERWRTVTDGAFNPAASSLVELLRDGDPTGEGDLRQHDTDRQAAIRERLRLMRQPLWTVNRARLHATRLTHLSVSLDAIAKGYIVDCAAQCAASVEGVTQVLVNIGGDLRHIGNRPLAVSVADPRASAENAAPIAAVRLTGEALATSGGYRRGFMMDGRHVSHILDPRSGRPARHAISASVIAPECASADALSTAFSVLTPSESIMLADSLPDIACMVVDEHGGVSSNDAWRARVIT